MATDFSEFIDVSDPTGAHSGTHELVPRPDAALADEVNPGRLQPCGAGIAERPSLVANNRQDGLAMTMTDVCDITHPDHLHRVAELLADDRAGILYHATPSFVANAFSVAGRRAIQQAKALPLDEVRTNALAVPYSHLAHFIRPEAHHPKVQRLLAQPRSLATARGGVIYNLVASDVLTPHNHLVRRRGHGIATAFIWPYDHPYLEELHHQASVRIREQHPDNTAMEVFAIQGTSANRHGLSQPPTLAEVDTALLTLASFILDVSDPTAQRYGPMPIVDLTGGHVDPPGQAYGLIRPGVYDLPPAVTHTLAELTSALTVVGSPTDKMCG